MSFVGNDDNVRNKVKNYFMLHNLEDDNYVRKLKLRRKTKLFDVIKNDYSNPIYRKEANLCQPNDTPSRREIYEKNLHIFSGNKILTKTVPTVTTKQDRNPNSGVIDYFNEKKGKSNFRYFTPRECFLLMGFDEKDYNNIINNNFSNRKREFFNIEKLNRMAGNSIVVNVLEEIFKQVDYLNTKVINEAPEDLGDGSFSISAFKNKIEEMMKSKTDSYQIIKS